MGINILQSVQFKRDEKYFLGKEIEVLESTFFFLERRRVRVALINVKCYISITRMTKFLGSVIRIEQKK